jgi:tetratricopeptide (TPR) repeat protein
MTILKNFIQNVLVMMPFNENYYRTENAGVLDAVARGSIRSLFVHYISHGYFEGRPPAYYYFPEFSRYPQYNPIPSEYFHHLCEAQDWIHAGRSDRAMILLQKASSLHSEVYYANYFAAQISYSSFRYLESIDFASRALSIRPHHRDAINYLVSALGLFEDSSMISSCLKKISMNISSRPAWLLIGLCINSWVRKDYPSAQRLLSELKPMNLSDSERMPLLAVQRGIGDIRSKLRAEFVKARSGTMTSQDACKALLQLARLGRPGFAKTIYERLNAGLAAPSTGELGLVIELISALYGDGGALTYIDRLAAIKPEANSALFDERIRIWTRLGRRKDICSAFASFGEFPTAPDVIRAIALALLQEQQYEQLLEYCRVWFEKSSILWEPYKYGVLAAAGCGALKGIHIDRNVVHREIVEADNGQFGSVIPKAIVQFWDTSPPPVEISEISDTWVQKNPTFSYVLFDEKSAAEFILSEYGNQTLTIFKFCHHPAMKADLFRLLYLARRGGYYVDADDECLDGFSWISRHAREAKLVVVTGFTKGDAVPALHLNNLFIGAVAKHPVIIAALSYAMDKLQTAFRLGLKADIWATTGPGALTNGFADIILGSRADRDEILHGIRVVPGGSHYEFVGRSKPLSYKGTADGNWRNA